MINSRFLIYPFSYPYSLLPPASHSQAEEGKSNTWSWCKTTNKYNALLENVILGLGTGLVKESPRHESMICDISLSLSQSKAE